MSINEKMIKLITKYQTSKSPTHVPRCVHYPSCSEYSKQCYQKFNFFKATFLTIKRILFCTPLNKKFYDPIPLSKEEKRKEKEIKKIAVEIKDTLIEHYQKYPKMQIVDFIKLIYQNTFGPHHLKAPSIEQITNYLLKEMNEVITTHEYTEDIGNNYYRLYLGKDSKIEEILESFYQETLIDTNSDLNISVFYRKIDVLISLIKKRIIKLPKKESINFIKEYLSNGINPVRHSLIYNNEYHPHYRVLKVREEKTNK